MTPDEVAQLLNIPRRTLGQWRYLNRGPSYVKVGRHIRYRRQDIETWLEVQRIDLSEMCVTANGGDDS